MDIQPDANEHPDAEQQPAAPAVDAAASNPGSPGDAPTILLVVDVRVADYESLAWEAVKNTLTLLIRESGF